MRRSETAAQQATTFLNARIVDPASGRDEPGGLLVKDATIADLGGHLRRNAPERTRVVDCRGHVLCPGLIDMQVFTGEPGQEHRETLKTASQAAAAGGVTTMVVMPDTEPVIDQVALVDFIQRRARDNAVVHVHVMAAMTRGLKGEEILKDVDRKANADERREESQLELRRRAFEWARRRLVRPPNPMEVLVNLVEVALAVDHGEHAVARVAQDLRTHQLINRPGRGNHGRMCGHHIAYSQITELVPAGRRGEFHPGRRGEKPAQNQQPQSGRAPDQD